MILVDTNVLSELIRPRPEPGVLTWFDAQRDGDLHLSVLTVGEIKRGATRLPFGPRRDQIEGWLHELLTHYEERVIGFDTETALRWGDLCARAAQAGRTLPVVDAMLAATALRHNLTLATRNTADFDGLDVRLVDPWR